MNDVSMALSNPDQQNLNGLQRVALGLVAIGLLALFIAWSGQGTNFPLPLFLAAAFILFHPGAVTSFLGFASEVKYHFFPVGIFLYGTAIFLQKMRVADSP